MIDAKEKERESKGVSKKVEETRSRLNEYWKLLKQELERNGDTMLDRTRPNTRFSIGTWKGRGLYNYCIGKKTIRVELYFTRGYEKEYFDALYNLKEKIEADFGDTFTWQRLDNKKASRIKYEYPASKFKEDFGSWETEEGMEKRVKWFSSTMRRFYDSINPYWEKVQNEIS